MLYSQLLNFYPESTQLERSGLALKLMHQTIQGRPIPSELCSYDKALLNACKEVLERKLKYNFSCSENAEYFESEYLAVVYRWLETIAHYDEYGMWYLKDLSSCSVEGLKMDGYKDDFAVMHFDNNVGKLIESFLIERIDYR